MAEKKKYKKLPQFVSPTAVFRFPKLVEPDKGNAKFPKPDGEYSVQLLMQKDSPEAQAFINLLTPTYEAALDEAKAAFKALPIKTRKEFEAKGIKGPLPNALFSIVYDKETEEETGEITFKFAMKASGKYRDGAKKGQTWTRKPVIADAGGNRMLKVPAIWGGTKGKVSFEAGAYFIEGTAAAGLRLALQGVQIIDLVTQGERSPESLGFKQEEGYAHTEQEPLDLANEPVETPASDDAGDF